MLRNTKELRGYRLGARDGEFGHLKDFFFDEQTWTVRYLVADTGEWLPHRRVLISPHAVAGLTETPHKRIELNLTRKQIEQSPAIATHMPISRQFEMEYYQYYGWPYYWPGPLLWGPMDFPGPQIPLNLPTPPHPTPPRQGEDAHLRSVNEIAGFHGYLVQGLDRAFGHIQQFIFEEASWAIRYLVADTRNWWPGKHVLVSPRWIAWISWSEARVYVDFDRDTIERAPAYDDSVAITRQYEQNLFAHFNRQPYWENSPELTRSK
ncbi:MAG TPA: PRC-barrel domain-containing protein [Verrucomicrobiae bacterium]|nr:PRC-barrel domain-containing protein [Verrucomicrobiae bacterium]